MSKMKNNSDDKLKKFDLNIEKILENWQIYDGIREIIANALDEQLITLTEDVKIFKKGSNWHIRDYGRGLNKEHFTMNENYEKIQHPNTIGKFGIGLKDAVATFYRKKVKCIIHSAYNKIEFGTSSKSDFDEIETLHALINEPIDPTMLGTEFILSNVSDESIDRAKQLFLKFTDDEILERTELGEVLKSLSKNSNIYFNGVKVSEEPNFIFSYNITSLDKKIKDAMNRERTNVGRNAYRDRIIAILQKCESSDVIDPLANDLRNIDQGTSHDELTWTKVQEFAVGHLSTKRDYIFTSTEDITDNPDVIDIARNSGHEVVHIPSKLKEKLRNKTDADGEIIRSLDVFNEEYQDSFEYKFVDYAELEDEEKKIFDTKDYLIKLIGGKPDNVNDILISATIKKDLSQFSDSVGTYEEIEERVIIRRDQLKSLEDFAGTLLHEIAHATSGYGDVKREFELELTKIIGKLASEILD